jgi:DNA recombination protein RmuC
MDIVITAVVTAAAAIVVFYFFIRLFSRKIESNILSKVQESFGTASFEALSRNSEEFLKLARESLSRETATGVKELEAKKELIDQTLNQIKSEMEKVEQLMNSIDKASEGKFAAVSEGIRLHGEETLKLSKVVNDLNKVLSASQSRGEWGERMAEDIMRLAGMEEGMTYIKQASVGNTRNRPDFTFILPQSKVVNMDVKFPFDNYRRYCEESNDEGRERYKKVFLRDARQRIKEITSREYINTDADTLDYALIFIPLDQAYSFIMEHDREFMDFALQQKIIVCSPWTLYAYLSVIRQSVNNFNMERSAGKILNLLNDVKKQWSNYTDSMAKVGERIRQLQEAYDHMVTTRVNQLDRPLQQIEQLSARKELGKDE